jgi:hypothetical protein
MANETVNAVGNQKVFVTLKTVLELQDLLRHTESEMVRRFQESKATLGDHERERLRLLTVEKRVEVDMLNRVIALLNLPIETQNSHRTLNRAA